MNQDVARCATIQLFFLSLYIEGQLLRPALTSDLPRFIPDRYWGHPGTEESAQIL